VNQIIFGYLIKIGWEGQYFYEKICTFFELTCTLHARELLPFGQACRLDQGDDCQEDEESCKSG
jgi:hypothetical protein